MEQAPTKEAQERELPDLQSPNQAKDNSVTSSNSNPNDTFWLARYAHNQLSPLFAQAKAIEPTLIFGIEITFADDSTVHGGNHISVSSHWQRDGMFQLSTWLRDRADVDRFVAKVAADVAALSEKVPA